MIFGVLRPVTKLLTTGFSYNELLAEPLTAAKRVEGFMDEMADFRESLEPLMP